MNVYLRANFQVSSISLTSFRQQGGNFTPPTPLSHLKNKPLKSTPRLGVSANPTNPQNGQRHLNNSSAVADEFFECV